jgi:hypothetical protein
MGNKPQVPLWPRVGRFCCASRHPSCTLPHTTPATSFALVAINSWGGGLIVVAPLWYFGEGARGGCAIIKWIPLDRHSIGSPQGGHSLAASGWSSHFIVQWWLRSRWFFWWLWLLLLRLRWFKNQDGFGCLITNNEDDVLLSFLLWVIPLLPSHSHYVLSIPFTYSSVGNHKRMWCFVLSWRRIWEKSLW